MEKKINSEENIDIVLEKNNYNKKIEEYINKLKKDNTDKPVLKNNLNFNNEEDDLPEDSEYMYTWNIVVFGAIGANLERVKIKKSEFKPNS